MMGVICFVSDLTGLICPAYKHATHQSQIGMKSNIGKDDDGSHWKIRQDIPWMDLSRT